MKRRGFLAAVAVLVAVPAMALDRRPKRRPKPDVSFPEYRVRANRDFMRRNRSYWARPRTVYGHYPAPWRSCSRREFRRAYPLPHGYPVIPAANYLQPGYKSPIRIWWEQYVKRGQR